MNESASTRPAPPIEAVPPSVLDPDGAPNFGLFRGIPNSIDFSALRPPHSRNAVGRFLRHKRWMYLFVATDDVVVAGAVVDAGPTGTGFLMITDRATGELLADVSRPGGTRPLVSVCDSPLIGHRSRYLGPGTAMSITGDDYELRFRATFHRLPYVPLVSDPWIELDLHLASSAHEGLTAVSEINDGGKRLVTTTAKNAALPSTGQLIIRDGGRAVRYDLAGGLGGFDFTSGFLPRHTSWRWAFLCGATSDGRDVGLNLVSGFTGIGDRADENAAWIDGKLHPLSPAARIDFDVDDPMRPWTVSTVDGAVDLRFEPSALHREGLNLGVLRSSFIQPTGHYTGTIAVDGAVIRIDSLPGVVEDQDVLW